MLSKLYTNHQFGKIGVVGASGFVGSNLLKKLSSQKFSIKALTRSPIKDLPDQVEWVPIDLFSAQSSFDALKGVDVAIYLVHSMMPSSRLFQGHFHDTDLLLADNFARACVANGVKHIIYLGGILPEDDFISQHLKSRFEVEELFKSTGIPFTVLRAGMIVGPGGSSFEILKTLVKRLPLMVLPLWTQKITQTIFIDDVLEVLEASIKNRNFINKTLNLVNGEDLTYRVLLRCTARAFGVDRPMLSLPFHLLGFSKLWVRFFGGASAELVSPLVDSLLCDLPKLKPEPLISKYIQYRAFTQMLREVLKREAELQFEKRFSENIKRPKRKILHEKSVRSIQRLPSVPCAPCDWIAREYMHWLPRCFPAFIKVKPGDEKGTIHFCLSFLPKPLLIIKYIQGSFEDDRQKFYIIGGLLSKTTNTGWLEFRQVQHKRYTLAAIHEFVPALPWPVYVATQAPIHKLVMHAFGRHLQEFNQLQSNLSET